MKREIKFRGKTLRTNEWIYGSLLAPFEDNGAVIFRKGESDALRRGNAIYPGLVSVDPSTVGQFTGLFDRNGKEIFEDDIVKYYDDIEDEMRKGKVFYHTNTCSFFVDGHESESIPLNVFWRWEVIGNVHDNPELLKK